MRIKNGFMLREIAGQWVVVPLGSRVVEFNSIITLTESGAMLWKLMERGAGEEEMIKALLAEYEVEEPVVRNDVLAFIKSITEKGLCE